MVTNEIVEIDNLCAAWGGNPFCRTSMATVRICEVTSNKINPYGICNLL